MAPRSKDSLDAAMPLRSIKVAARTAGRLVEMLPSGIERNGRVCAG